MGKINNSKNTKIYIIGGILFFFGIIFIYNLIKLGIFNQDTHKTAVLNNKVLFDQPKLTIFDETRYINQFPDTIHIHYPYFIVVVPEDTKQITTVYSFTEKKEITSFNDIVLDYNNGNFLYNYHGGNTFYKGKNLNNHCNLGFIKSDTEILCVIQNTMNPLFSNLIVINPQTVSEETLYSPQDAITAIYYDNNTLYVSEYNYTSHQPYVTINNKKTAIRNYSSILYPINNTMYTATFKNDKNNLTASYSEISKYDNTITINHTSHGKIEFF